MNRNTRRLVPSAIAILVALLIIFSQSGNRDAAYPGVSEARAESPSLAPAAPGTSTDYAPAPAAPSPDGHSDSLDLSMVPAGERSAVTRVAGLIDAGSSFPHEQDGSIFRNAERRLPGKRSRYYREYTVPTPGAATRGARRVVAGGDGELYYTNDHYRTFLLIRSGNTADR